MKRRIATVLVLVSAVSACTGGSEQAVHDPRTARGEHPVVAVTSTANTESTHVTRSWSKRLAGVAGGMESDGDGAVLAVGTDAVVAIDRRGAQRWSAAVAGADSGWPVLGRGLVVMPMHSGPADPGGCVALDRTTGERKWTYEEPSTFGATAAFAGDDVICGLGSGVVVAVDSTTGKRRWRSDLRELAPDGGILPRSALAVDDASRSVTVTVTSDGLAVVVVLDLATGERQAYFDFSKYGTASAPVRTAPGFVAVGVSERGHLCEINLHDMSYPTCPRVAASTGFSSSNVPIFVDGLVLLPAADGSVSAFDTRTHKLRWARRAPYPIVATRLVAVAGVVMFSDWTQTPFALRVTDGKSLAGPALNGMVDAIAADGAGGFLVAVSHLDAHKESRIERWVAA